MPESPEVTHMKDELLVFKNAKITNITKITKNLKIKLPIKIKEVSNKGKFLYIILSNDYVIGFSLGMTGKFIMNEDIDKHTIITFRTNRGSFQFNDVRRFGKVYVYNNKQLKDKLNTLGPDALKELPDISQVKFNEMLKLKSNKILCDVLLDQTFLSGIGNAYRAEIMYRSKLHPLRLISSLSSVDKRKLKKSIEYIIQKYYKNLDAPLKIYGNSLADKIKRKDRTVWFNSTIQI